MLVPGQLYKEDIKRELVTRWYEPKYQWYFAGWREETTIGDNANFRRDYAYIDKDNDLAGFFTYAFNETDRSMNNFGLIGFKNNNIPFVQEVLHHVMNMFASGEAQRAEVWAYADNPVCKLYRRFAEQYNGTQIAYCHRTNWFDGKYHDSIAWEWLVENVIVALNSKYPNQYCIYGDISSYQDIG